MSFFKKSEIINIFWKAIGNDSLCQILTSIKKLQNFKRMFLAQ